MGPDAHVLDVATGTGAVAERLVRRFGCRVTGIDQSADMLAAARTRLAGAGLADRVTLLRGEAESLPFPDATFDALTVTYLLRYVDDPAAVLRELARVVRRGGVVASMEFGVPPRALPRAAWRLYTGVLLPAGGMAVGGGGGGAPGASCTAASPTSTGATRCPRCSTSTAPPGSRTCGCAACRSAAAW